MTATDTAGAGAPSSARPARRKEDARLITGQTNWTDNIMLPGMLHMAFLRSPYAHARITSVDVSARPEHARRHRRLLRRRLRRRAGQPALRLAGHRRTSSSRPHPPMATDEVRYVGEAVAVRGGPRPLRGRRRPRRHRRRLRAAAAGARHGGPRWTRARPWCTRRATRATSGSSTSGDLDAAFRDAPVVIERELPPAAADPGARWSRARWSRPCVGGEFTLWSATQIPHVLRFMLAPGHRHPGAQDPGHRPRRRRRLRRQAAGHRRGSARGADRPQARQAGQVDRDPQRGQHDRRTTAATRWQQIRIAADQRRPDPRPEGRPARRHGRLPACWSRRACRCSARSCSTAIYKMDALPRSRCTGVFTTKMPTDAYRGAGRPEATFAIERIMDELAAELGIDPLELREQNWIKHEEFPYTTIAGLTYDIGQLRGGHRQGHGAVRLRRAARRAGARGGPAGDPVQLGIGISTFTEMCGLAPSRVLGSLSYGAGGWEHASIRMLPTGKVEVVTGSSAARPGPRDGVEPDRRRPARRAVRGHRGAARRHPGLAQGHGHLRLPVAGRRRHGHATARASKVIEKAKVIAAHHARGQPRTTSSSPPAGSRSRATREQGHDHPGDRPGHLRRAQPARRHRAHARLRRHLRPGELLLPARHAPVRDRGRHRDRPGHASARTCASTTSARSSTR